VEAIYTLVSQVYLLDFFHTYFTTVLYFLPISPFSTWPPQHLVKGTNYEAPHYIIFSSLLVPAMLLKTLSYGYLSPIIQTYAVIKKKITEIQHSILELVKQTTTKLW